MVKKLIALLLILNAFSLSAMTPSDPQGKRELDFINAVAKGDISTIGMQLAQGKDAKQVFRLQGFENTTPLQLALRDTIAVFDYKSGKPQLVSVVQNNGANKYAIADLLLLRGANKADLDNLLQIAVASGNVRTALWILDKGVLDRTGNLLKIAQDREKNEKLANVKAEWTQVVRRLQEQKDKQLQETFTRKNK